MVSPLIGKSVLVTGGTGLVGSHLAEKLVSLGVNVFSTYRSMDPRSYFIEQKLDQKIVMVICDISDAVRTREIVVEHEIEYIFHVAAQAIVTSAYLNPYQTFSSNIMGTVNILEAARMSPYIKGVIIASSDKAYGKDCLNANENQKLDGDHPYDVSKASADLIAKSYCKTYNLPITISRFGNIFGPGDLNPNRLIPGIMEAIITGEILKIRSDGTFIRDYVYVKDVVDGYILLAEQMARTRGEAFNFSSGYNCSVLDLIQKVSSILGRECRYEVVNNQRNEIPRQSLDYQKARQVLNWQPRCSFEEAIKQTHSWYKDYFNKDQIYES